MSPSNFPSSLSIGSSVAWLSFAQLAKYIWDFSVGIVLARILDPDQFGIFAVSLVFYGLCQVISIFGIPNIIIQKKDISDNFIDTAQTVSLSLSVLALISLLLLSKTISFWYKEPLLSPILNTLAFLSIINSLNVIPASLLTKRMAFHLVALIDIGASLAYGITSILAASNGLGIWSLVVGPFSSALFSTILSSILAKRIPTFSFNLIALKEIFKFGTSLSFASLLNHLARNIDYVIITKVLGPHSCGLYKRAYDLATLPKDKLMDILASVFLPKLSAIQDDLILARKITLVHLQLATYTCLPALFGICSIAEELISVIYGDKWISSIIPLQIIAIGGLFYILSAIFTPIIISFKRTTALILIQIIYSLCLIIGILIGSRFGLIGASIGVTFAIAIFSLCTFSYASKLINLSLYEYFQSFLTPLMISIIMFLAIKLFPFVFAGLTNTKFIMLGKIFLGIIIYSSMMLYFSLAKINRLRLALKEN